MTKKDEISKKAWELFLKRGYDKTPISDIAKTIGSSKGGLYHYFSNKEILKDNATAWRQRCTCRVYLRYQTEVSAAATQTLTDRRKQRWDGQ